MSDNSKARQQLESIYGKGCMFKKARIEDQIEALRTIKTYKTFLRETRYTGKKIRLLEKNMTYHHLRHASEGGKATVENGAVVNELAHRYLHSLPREQEETVNNMLRKFKLQGGIIAPTENGLQTIQPIQIDLDFDFDLEDYHCNLKNVVFYSNQYLFSNLHYMTKTLFQKIIFYIFDDIHCD